MLSCFSWVWLFVTLWTVAHQASLSVGFSRLLFPWDMGVGCHVLLQGSFLPRGRTLTLVSLALAGGFFTIGATWEAPMFIHLFIFKAFIEHITILLLFFLLVFSFLANESLLYDVGSSSLVFYDNLERRVEWSGTWEGGSRWMGHMCTSGWFMLIYGRN